MSRTGVALLGAPADCSAFAFDETGEGMDQTFSRLDELLEELE